MEFRIVENPEPEYVRNYDLFVDLYNNMDISVENIRRELGWSVKVYKRAREKALEEGKIVDRREYRFIINKLKPTMSDQNSPKNYSYYKNANKFVVKKSVFDEKKGSMVNGYYGLYEREDVVQRIVEELEKVDWDKSKLDEIKEKVRLEIGLDNL